MRYCFFRGAPISDAPLTDETLLDFVSGELPPVPCEHQGNSAGGTTPQRATTPPSFFSIAPRELLALKGDLPQSHLLHEWNEDAWVQVEAGYFFDHQLAIAYCARVKNSSDPACEEVGTRAVARSASTDDERMQPIALIRRDELLAAFGTPSASNIICYSPFSGWPLKSAAWM